MSGARRIRRSLVFGVLFVFALARVAFAGEACDFSAGDCPPAAIGAAAAHGAGHHHGELCATQSASAPAAGVALAPANTLDAGPAIAVVLTVPASLDVARRWHGRRVLVPASVLLTSGRLRF